MTWERSQVSSRVLCAQAYKHWENRIPVVVPEPVVQHAVAVAAVLSYRLYFIRRGPVVVVLLAGGDKSTQGADIKRAIDISKEWRD